MTRTCSGFASLALGIALATILLSVNAAHAREVPYLSGRVVDEADLFSPDFETQLSEKLAAHEAETSNQIAVLTIPSLEGEVLEQYSLKVAETWALGQKDKDNGALLLIARDDRKLRIEVGYGLEGALTDALANRIIENEIVPRFKQGDFQAGTAAGVDAMLAAIAGEYTPEDADDGVNLSLWPPRFTLEYFLLTIWIIPAGLFVFSMLSRIFLARDAGGWLPFFFFGIMGYFLLYFLSPEDWPPHLLPILVLGAIFVWRLVLVLTPFGRRLSQSYEDSAIGGWALSAGSGSGGGGFSGGGGSFGGGGASGSW